MKSLSQLKKLSAEQLVAEFTGSSFPFDFAECSSCLLQHFTDCSNPEHIPMTDAVHALMVSNHGESRYFGDRIEENITQLYKLRVKYAKFFSAPVPTKFPRIKRKKHREIAPLLHSIYTQDRRTRGVR